MSATNRAKRSRRLTASLPCIVCGKQPEDVSKLEDNHPVDAVICRTTGNYGSRIFDENGGHYLEVNVCDKCLTEAAEKNRVALGFIDRVVGPPMQYWRPGLEDHYPSQKAMKKARRGRVRIENMAAQVREMNQDHETS